MAGRQNFERMAADPVTDSRDPEIPNSTNHHSSHFDTTRQVSEMSSFFASVCGSKKLDVGTPQTTTPSEEASAQTPVVSLPPVESRPIPPVEAVLPPSTPSGDDKIILTAEINAKAEEIRVLKSAKGDKDAIKKLVDQLLALKTAYKEKTGEDFAAPALAKETVPKEVKKDKKPKAVGETTVPADSLPAEPVSTGPALMSSLNEPELNLKVWLLAGMMQFPLEDRSEYDGEVITSLPAMSVEGSYFFGANNICKNIYMKAKGLSELSSAVQKAVEMEEVMLRPVLKMLSAKVKESKSTFQDILDKLTAEELMQYNGVVDEVKSLESDSALLTDPLVRCALFSSLEKFLALDTGLVVPVISALVAGTSEMAGFSTYVKKAAIFEDVDLSVVDWSSAGLLRSLKLIFSAAIRAAVPPQHRREAALYAPSLARCGNPAHGDYQCNNAMALAKSLKGRKEYAGSTAPKDVAELISKHIPVNPLITKVSIAPNGFINMDLSSQTIISSIADIVRNPLRPPAMPKLRTLVDFSSPNIAKEMHVGHLRSTIIGDSLCRVLEFCGHDVLRVNHVGDWGTQFGMLITFLTDEFPDILTNPPNISDLTAIYKASKKRFDENESFKERSRLNVVRLQAGDLECRAVWTLLCDISRLEFQKVYDALGVKLTEVGESYYNPMIPSTIEELLKLGLAEEDQGMLLVKQEKYQIPLIVRKSDGGYGYDSTDMAAILYRLRELKRDWIVYITDAGQAMHFHMCFDAARSAGWVQGQRLDHIGFGVVCGEDGKRFKTRSSETVRLIDLLDESKLRMETSLKARQEENKTSLGDEDLLKAARSIGYGAVKYFDLRQHPTTNYIFNYDRMLDTKGDTAVYLLFAYARISSILRKANEDKGISIVSLTADADTIITIEHPAERALAFEILQFGDVIRNTVDELLPNRLCDFLKDMSTKATDFITKCHVLNSAETNSRLLLCEASRKVMQKLFDLLGIESLERL